MNAKLTLAIATAATLVAAPAAFAQSSANSYGNTQTVPYERSTQHGLPSANPQVESLSGNKAGARIRAMPTAGNWNSNSTANNGLSASSAPNPMGGATNGSMNRRVIADLNHIPDGMQRRGPGQNHTELMQTALLNTFSAQGYTTVRDFHKQGSMYVAQAEDPHGNWSTVQIDPTSGTIVALRQPG